MRNHFVGWILPPTKSMFEPVMYCMETASVLRMPSIGAITTGMRAVAAKGRTFFYRIVQQFHEAYEHILFICLQSMHGII